MYRSMHSDLAMNAIYVDVLHKGLKTWGMLGDIEESAGLSHWRFRDGTGVHEDLGSIELSRIRAACDQQSRTKWTSIASRQRLYQFIALSDEDTQQEMRLKALSLMDLDTVPCARQFGHSMSTVGISVNQVELNEDEQTIYASTSGGSRTKRKRSIDDTLSFFDGQNIHEVFHQFSIANLKAICQRITNGSWPRTRSEIYLLITQLAPPIQEQIHRTVLEAIQTGDCMYSRRRRSVDYNQHDVEMMAEGTLQDNYSTENAIENLCQGPFMKVPSKEMVNAAIEEFIDRTGNAALAAGICAICARETPESELSLHRLHSIPNSHCLKPRAANPNHDLFDGMLLHPPGVENDVTARRIPYELAYLTLPERILIAKYFPAAYIIKLYPKRAGARHWDKRQMYSGLKGNVSTYRLDQSQIASMIDGSTMPQAVKVLAATIGITFVGPKNLPEKSLPNMFRVRRARVKRALEWLKENNPIFRDITISTSRLAQLPEDDIPYELIATAKHSTDVNTLYAEQDGYVPVEETNEEENAEAEQSEISDMEDGGVPTEPAVLALLHLGVVDIDGVDVTETELMAHALANCAQARREEDYMIRRGSAFVNEYARVDPSTGQQNDGGPSDANHLLGCFPTLFPYGQGGFEIDRVVNVPYEAHNILSTLTADDLTKASREETRGVAFSNPAVRILQSQLSAVKTKVQGSDESRNSIRSKIWGTNLLHNPPSLWVTINPSDTQDPIAQVLAGADINLDAFCKTAGPDGTDRALNMASDPYASAKFFHLMINTILEVLIGFSKRRNGIVVRKEGIFGVVQSYVGTVEAQGRGSLHLHLLLWLAGAPTARELNQALSNEDFCEKVKRYIRETIRANVDMKSEGELHKCSYNNCLKVVKGRVVCKHRAPFPLAQDDWVDNLGGWGPKRLCGYLNKWNPPLLMTIRANHDIKLIMSGQQTNVLTWYITNYASKKQQRSSNVSALLAKRVAFHVVEERRRRDLTDVNKRLIQRCANTLTRDREFSGLEIMSYLMGWGDRFESHHYVAIYSDALISALKEKYPGLRKTSIQQTQTEDLPSSDATAAGDDNRTHVISMESGMITLKDQLHEYMFRGDEMINLNLLTFMVDTYDSKGEQIDDSPDSRHVGTNTGPSLRGRHFNQRVPYRPGFNKVGHSRIFRTDGHETLPHLVGSWLPRNDRPRDRELYCASILILLKPWTNLSGLKTEGETFEQSFNCFVAGSTKKTLDIIENIQYYYECYDGAKKRQEERTEGTERTIDFEDEVVPNDLMDSVVVHPEAMEITEDNIDLAYETRGSMRELLYAQVAMNTAFDCGIFSEIKSQTVFLHSAERATTDDMNIF
ncbi:hypothetical protein BYT27DRAFT_7214713 [Phlegmacium glaucopus]|nr:hypothetical protein BYT27DRAFT_7214713 [Phlegmacium glaucopus]